MNRLYEAQTRVAQAALLLQDAIKLLPESRDAPQRESILGALRRCERAELNLRNAIKRSKRAIRKAEQRLHPDEARPEVEADRVPGESGGRADVGE